MDSMWLFWTNGIARNVTTDSYKRINQIQMTIGLKTFALLGSENYSIYHPNHTNNGNLCGSWLEDEDILLPYECSGSQLSYSTRGI